MCIVCIAAGAFAKGKTKTSQRTDKGKVVLELLSLSRDPGPQAAMKEITEKFTRAHPNITFDVQTMTSDNLKTTLRARFASNDMPDIITWMKEVEPEYMENLAGETFLNNLNASSLAAANAIYADGSTFAMPVDSGYIGMYYNKDVLNKYGLSVPKTLSELKNACEVLKQHGVVPFATGCLDLSVPYVGLIAIFAETVYGQNPSWSAERDAGQHKITTDPGWIKAFTLLKDYVYGYADQANTFNMGSDESYAYLMKGKSAFLVQGSWALSGLRALNPDANIGLAAFPVSEKPADAKLLAFPDTSFSIMKGTKHSAEAKAFLAYLASPEAGEIWSRNVRVASTVKGVSVNYDPVSADINGYLSSGQFTPYGDRVLRSIFTDKLWESFSEYMLGMTKWEPFAATLDEFWDKALAAEKR